MIRSVFSLWLCAVLVGCQPETPMSGDGTDLTSDTDYLLSVDLALGVSSPSNIDYPLTVRARIEGGKGSEYALSLNDTLIESARLPAKGTFNGGPFSGTEGPTNYRYAYFVIGEPGEHTVSVSLSRDEETVRASQLLTVGPVCDANENFYAQANLMSRFSCGNCHEPGGTASFEIDGSSYASISQVKKYAGSQPYVMANMPANLDPTPAGFGGELNHSGGQKWVEGSTTHVRMLELAYRVSTDFNCP